MQDLAMDPSIDDEITFYSSPSHMNQKPSVNLLISFDSLKDGFIIFSEHPKAKLLLLVHYSTDFLTMLSEHYTST